MLEEPPTFTPKINKPR